MLHTHREEILNRNWHGIDLEWSKAHLELRSVLDGIQSANFRILF
ncbi:hypothetical protein TA5114_02695 [Cognatishimia activa]|uniref:Uncharacterized protein n=1 Tax=Cognatishimia activa TaxID=1715691 RepID=A0A0P1ITT6_9RHOB|nr:hypothetical protein TA5113_01527 [Cognatishimia activa]CUK26877.1 hypothetical protein TA5114_02695 [Cognatishimia activa]